MYGTCQRLCTRFRKNRCFQLRIIRVICPHESAVKYADIISTDDSRIRISSTLQPEAETMILHKIENLLPSATTSVLQDVGNLPNNSRDTGIQKFTISYVIIDRAMSGCRSRRNLAARLR